MRHIDYDNKTRTERTAGEWLRVGANIAEYANEWAARNDLVAFIGEGATGGYAPALFKPAIAEIEVNVEIAFGFGIKPDSIGNLCERSTRYEFPKAAGAILHEAFHARFSRWNLSKIHEDLAADEAQALILLEESRIEKQGLDLDSKNRLFLRACAMDIALSELSAESMGTLTIAGAAQLVGLVQARVIAGILEADEVAEVLQIVREKLGEPAYLRLSEIADKFQQHENHWNIEGAYPLAKEWAQIVRDLQQEAGEQPNQQGEGSGSGASGEGEGEMSDELSDLLGKLQDAADSVSISNAMDLADQEMQEDWDEQVQERKSKSKEQADHRDVAEDVFGRGTGEVEGNGTHSRLAESRAPLGIERAAAVTVAKMLEKAKYRDRDITVVQSQEPQGRLNVRAAMQNDAYKAQGGLPTAREWSRKVRKQTDEPKLTVGVMVDISGSMRSAMEPMATTAWVMSEAVRRVQGRTAMVYYGQDVFPTLKAGQHLGAVNVWTANDPTEKFDKAFKSLDGALNLLHGNGARLLVVVSDGVYTDIEQRKATEWMKRCEENGVAVLWLTYQRLGNAYAARLCRGTKAVVLEGILDPAGAAVEIGKAAAKALETRRVAA